MQYTVQLEQVPAGYVAQPALPGQPSLIQTSGFYSSEDGEALVRLLEGFPQEILSAMPQGKRLLPSQVDHLLAFISKNKKATVFVNHLSITASIQARGPLAAGDPVMTNHIMDILGIDLGIQVPPDCGLAFVFSVGWRRGFLFDFTPLQPDGDARTYGLSRALASCYARVTFQQRFSLSDLEWDRLMGQQWFLFVGLSEGLLRDIISHVRENWDVDRLLPRMSEEAQVLASSLVERCDQLDAFVPHSRVLALAFKHFKQGDYVSAAHLLYPRLEGVLRSHYSAAVRSEKPNQASLIDAAVKTVTVSRHPETLFLPSRFQEYLRRVMFADFDWRAPEGISRHTVGHGVVDPDRCDEKAVVIAFLALHQLYAGFLTANSPRPTSSR